MIQTILTHKCPQCGSQNMVKNGRDYKGAQKYHGKACESYGTLHTQRDYHDQTRQVIEAAGCRLLFQLAYSPDLDFLDKLDHQLVKMNVRVSGVIASPSARNRVQSRLYKSGADG